MNKKLLIAAAALVVLVIVGVSVANCTETEPDPREVAREWASDLTDAASEGVLRVVLDALGEEGLLGVAIAELGGEWLEDRINENTNWTISEPAPKGDSYIVKVTGNSRFEVDRGFLKGGLNVTFPFELTIQGDRVFDSRLLVDEVSVSISN